MSSTYKFFKKKKPWSKFKDKMIDWYLKPYISKILYTNKPLYVIDCFAGKGKFDDGCIGSPLIIANHIKDIIENKNISNKNITGIFIEKKYYNDLTNNLSNYKNCIVKKGIFEHYVEDIALKAKYANIFMYIDPYGIKSLNNKYFQKICDNAKLYKNSIEIFINFNSFGFIRQACNVLSVNNTYFEDTDDDFVDEILSNDMLSQVYNGTAWIELVENYKNGIYNAHQLEEEIVKGYQKVFNELFKYNLNIPIKTKEKNIPKYRMMFFSNHEDGILLMNEKMHKTLIEMCEKSINGQLSFIEAPIGSAYEYTSKVENLEYYIDKILCSCDYIEYKKLICEIMNNTNIYYTEKNIKDMLTKYYNNNLIKLNIRNKRTQENYNELTFDTRKFQIYLRKNHNL